ncbi:PPE domain-containing protein [Umezawaea tangerina]|uniref:PPE family protein n=1 Tax=Umezawaea tangerina TaxID=84725 RepID=A0A2T0TLJ0_9PSEU|nr:PPE domain-containing protein [Umezawaea tangerina]PRY46536.1 PPE family protein [Umezawaea tangerina]
MAPEADPVLTDTQNWASVSHRALYDSVHVNNDPGQSGELGSEWAQFGTELSESAQVITERITASESGWTGESADGARTAIKKLSDWIAGTAQTAGQVGDKVADQGRVMQDARASMPEPVEFDYASATAQLVSGGLPGLIAATASIQQANAKANAAHDLAVMVMTNMEASSRAIDQTTPTFTAPYNPVTGQTEDPQVVMARSSAAPNSGGAVDGLQMMTGRTSTTDALQSRTLADGTAAGTTSTAGAVAAPPSIAGGSFDGGGAGAAGAGGAAAGYNGGSGAAAYTGGGAAGGGGYTGASYAGPTGGGAGVPTGGSYPTGGGYGGGGSYTGGGGSYTGATLPGGGFDDDESESAYRAPGTTSAAAVAGSIPVANPYTPGQFNPGGGYTGTGGGYTGLPDYTGGGGTGMPGGYSGTGGNGSSPSRTGGPGSAGYPGGAPGSIPTGSMPKIPGLPVEGGGTGIPGRGLGGFGTGGAGGGAGGFGGAGAGAFGGGAGAGGFGGASGGGVGGAAAGAGAGGSTGVVQTGRPGMPGGFGPGAPGAAGAAGAMGGGMPMGGHGGGRSEEDKEHKSASYIMGGDLFEVPGDDLPPSVIGGVKPAKKKSGDQ